MANIRLKIPPLLQAAIWVLAMWQLDKHLPLLSFTFACQSTVAAILSGLGGIIALSGIYSFRKADTTVDPRTPGKTGKLVVTGIYRYSRNPMYLGLLLVIIGLAVHLGSLSPFLLMPLFIWFMNRLQIEPEEEALYELFGEDYGKYLLKVRRWL